jgi:hypothetical protein
MPHLKAGKIKALVINGARRSSLMPTCPFLESGYKGFEQYGWIGALFPAGVAPDRVALMSSEMSRIIKLPHMQQRLRELNLEPLGSNADDFAKVLANDLSSWTRLVTELGIQERTERRTERRLRRRTAQENRAGEPRRPIRRTRRAGGFDQAVPPFASSGAAKSLANATAIWPSRPAAAFSLAPRQGLDPRLEAGQQIGHRADQQRPAHRESGRRQVRGFRAQQAPRLADAAVVVTSDVAAQVDLVADEAVRQQAPEMAAAAGREHRFGAGLDLDAQQFDGAARRRRRLLEIRRQALRAGLLDRGHAQVADSMGQRLARSEVVMHRREIALAGGRDDLAQRHAHQAVQCKTAVCRQQQLETRGGRARCAGRHWRVPRSARLSGQGWARYPIGSGSSSCPLLGHVVDSLMHSL